MIKQIVATQFQRALGGGLGPEIHDARNVLSACSEWGCTPYAGTGFWLRNSPGLTTAPKLPGGYSSQGSFRLALVDVPAKLFGPGHSVLCPGDINLNTASLSRWDCP